MPAAAEPIADAAGTAAAGSDAAGTDAALGAEVGADVISAVQGMLAGTSRTGIPQVDAALERLADLDPGDLGAASEVLADVLGRLESALADDGRPGPAES